MNKRLWIWVTVVLAVFTAIIVAVELSSEHNYKKAILSSRLEGYADIVSKTDDYSRTTALLPENIRVSVIRPDGAVAFDSYETAEAMGNHLSRPEIAAAREGGKEGCSIRKSETSGIEYIYFAKRYGDVIVRTALPFEVTQRRFMHPDWMLLITIALLFAAAALVIRQLSIHAGAAAEMDTDEKLRSQKRRITGNLAHELRTPVTSIRGYLETLVNNPDIQQDKRVLFTERAYLQTLRLSDMIRDISLITKIEEAPELLIKEHLGIRKIAEEVFDEFSLSIRECGITVENLLSEGLCLKANQSLVYAIFRNLVENSIRYGGSGITIHLECSVADGAAHFIYYDNGAGVSEEHIGRIFERFYRIPEENAHHAEGSGLGLSIVKNAVAFHGGRVSASNMTPHGLCFRFTIPEL